MTLLQKPRLYYNNRSALARGGDDGTAYAVGDEAFRIPGNLFGVRSALSYKDGATLTSLIGGKLVMDTSKNRYNITGVDSDNGKILDAVIGKAASNSYKDCFLDSSGTYIIIVCDAVIYVLVRASLALHATRVMDTGYHAVSGCISSDGNYIFICGYEDGTTKGWIKKYLLNNNLDVAAEVLLETTDLYAKAVYAVGSYVYAACQEISGKGRLVRCIATDCTRYDACVFNAGENNPVCIAAGPSSIYVQCADGSNVTVIVKVTISSFTRTDTVTLNATEYQARGMVAETSDLYVAVKSGTNVGSIVKIAYTPSLTRVSAVSLGANHESPYAVGFTATHIYVTSSNAAKTTAYVDKIQISTFAGLAATFTCTYDDSAAMVLDTSYIYILSNENVSAGTYSAVEKILLSGFTSSLAKPLPNGLKARSIASDEVYIYALVAIDSSYNAMLLQILRSTGEVTDSISVGRTVTSDGGSITVYGNFLYIACYQYVVRVYLPDFSLFGEVNIATLTNPKKIIASGSYIYVLDASSPSKIHRLTYTPFAAVDKVDFIAGENTASDLCEDTDNLYATLDLASGKIVKTAKSPFARSAVLTVNANPKAIAAASGYVYAAGAATSIARVETAGFTLTDTTVLASAVTGPTKLFAINGYLVVICQNASNQMVTVRLKTGASLTDETAATYTENGIPGRGWALDTADQIAIITTYTSLPSIAVVSIYSGIDLAESLLDSDVGDSFTIRAGHICAQADADYPLYNAADARLVPLFKATLNTETKIRIHSPNQLQDGGFESGTFTPNWTASGGAWTINTANKLEGAYSAKCDLSANHTLIQSITDAPLKAGQPYRLIYKAKADTANLVTGGMTIGIYTGVTGTVLPVTAGDPEVSPEISTSAAWYELTFTPTKKIDNWQIKLTPDSTKKGSTGFVIYDEFYLYEDWTVNSLWTDFHNWFDRAITVNAWKLSPLRSTAASDAANKTQIGSFTVDDADKFVQSLTSTTSPVIEIVLPAAAGWTPEAGEIYVGDYLEVPKYPGNLDPWRKNENGLREYKFTFKNIPTSYRKAQIETLFERAWAGEAILVQWDTEAPVLCELTDKAKEASYNPVRIDWSPTFVERQ